MVWEDRFRVVTDCCIAAFTFVAVPSGIVAWCGIIALEWMR